MNNFKKIVAIVSFLGLGSVLSAPAHAGSVQAYATGSSTIVLMNGASQSVGGEISLPSGSSFDGATAGSGNLLVTPSLTTGGSLETNDTIFVTLEVNAGAATASPAGSSFTASAAQVLDNAATLADQVSIIRAGAGVDGLD